MFSQYFVIFSLADQLTIVFCKMNFLFSFFSLFFSPHSFLNQFSVLIQQVKDCTAPCTAPWCIGVLFLHFSSRDFVQTTWDFHDFSLKTMLTSLRACPVFFFESKAYSNFLLRDAGGCLLREAFTAGRGQQ